MPYIKLTPREQEVIEILKTKDSFYRKEIKTYFPGLSEKEKEKTTIRIVKYMSNKYLINTVKNRTGVYFEKSNWNPYKRQHVK